MEYSNQTLNLGDCPSASALIAEAYMDNPAHEYFCPQSNKRFDQLQWLLGANLKLQLQYGALSFCYKEKGEVLAMGYWTRPDQNLIGLYEKIGAGLLRAPMKLGWTNFLSMMHVSNQIDKNLNEISYDRPHCYLNNMAVKKELRGKGMGSKILTKGIDQVLSIYPDAVLSLSTQKEINVTFYERFGFEVSKTEMMGTGANAFKNWTMVRG